MKAKFLIATFILINSACASCETYKYVDYVASDAFEQGKATFILNTDTKQISSSDTVDEIEICAKNSSFFCFVAPFVSFYVPKGRLNAVQKWAAGGEDFEVLRQEVFSLFGVQRKVWIIKSSKPDRDDYFYFSETYGLLAIKNIYGNSKKIHFFMITGAKGFPQ